MSAAEEKSFSPSQQVKWKGKQIFIIVDRHYNLRLAAQDDDDDDIKDTSDLDLPNPSHTNKQAISSTGLNGRSYREVAISASGVCRRAIEYV